MKTSHILFACWEAVCDLTRLPSKAKAQVASGQGSRLVNKCMSMHLNANANISCDSNAIANAIFQERMQMQMF